MIIRRGDSMKSTDVIVGGLILILIVASGAFFMQITEMRHEMELQAREIDEAMRGEDYVPQKEVESFSKEISLRIEGLSVRKSMVFCKASASVIFISSSSLVVSSKE